MRIENLRLEKCELGAAAHATVKWEDCEAPAQDVFFATDREFSDHITCNPDAFLLGAILPAAWRGERRVKLDEEISLELREGISTAMAWFREWNGPVHLIPQIDAPVKLGSRLEKRVKCAGGFLSGGIDSLALLRANRLTYHQSHPRSIRVCFFVYGFDMGHDLSTYDRQKGAFARVFASLSRVAQSAEVMLIPVYTNIRHLESSMDFWMHEFHGAALSSIAHSFTPLVRIVYIASSLDTEHMEPWGSHPLIDPCYSSEDLQIIHYGVTYSRFDKIRLVTEWEPALQTLRVCTQINRWAANLVGPLNCGTCEKCVRAMTALLALGALSNTSVFPNSDVSPKLLRRICLSVEYPQEWTTELFDLLMKEGRHDLVRAIRIRTATYLIKRFLKRVDQKLLKGRASSFKKNVFNGFM